MGIKSNAPVNKKKKKTGWIIGGIAAVLLIGALGEKETPIETVEDISADDTKQEIVTTLMENDETVSEDIVRSYEDDFADTDELPETKFDLIVLPVETIPDETETETIPPVVETETELAEVPPPVIETAAAVVETVPAVVETEAITITYILNTSTKKIHYQSCSSVKDILEKNKGSTTDYVSAINSGYVPCKKCNP